MTAALNAHRAPRLVVKILGFSFGVIAAVLVAVFVLLSWQTRERLTRAIVANMEASQLRVADTEARRQREHRLQASSLAENPTLKAAVDTYHAERSAGGATAQLLNTIRVELEKMEPRVQVPVLSVTDTAGLILASTGVHAADWAAGDRLASELPATLEPVEAVITRGHAVYFATIVPLTFGADVIGEFVLASPVDAAYAHRLARETSTDIVVRHGTHVIASSMPEVMWAAINATGLPADGGIRLADEEYVTRRLLSIEPVSVYALGSVSGPVRAATGEAVWVFVLIGCGALLLAAGGSWWLARTLASPIDELRRTLQRMAEVRDFERPLPAAGASFELDALTDTFDGLRAAVAAAEAESEAAYLGVIGALAAALDARDPYTAGHSERVARLSVSIGRAMGLPEAELEVLHLGALLHDIGKIGVSDMVLRKPGTLTDDEFDQIRRHPTLGARILKPLNFLAEHVAIVELHHEQPDGRGYPFGLKGDEIPLPARIVHVADAFDAMTSARAYRPGRPANEAIAELWHHVGTGFDLQVVQAITSLPVEDLPASAPPAVEADVAHPAIGGLLVPFRLRAAGAGRQRSAAG
jgi:putative nucleotidyltransferase with HDIG domain